MAPSRLRSLLPKLVLLAVSGLLSLGAAEVALRLVRPQAVMLVGRGFYAPDPPEGYRLHPGYRGKLTNRVEFATEVAINHLGLRGPEVGPKRPGHPRVLVLGDSFVFGIGAEEKESYPRRLEEALRSRGVEAEVLNAGVPGYGIPHLATWYERHGRKLDPDLIVVTSFLGNDFFDASPLEPKAHVVNGQLVIGNERHDGILRWLYYHSHLFLAVKNSTLGDRLRALLGRKAPLDARWHRAELELLRRGDLDDLAERGGVATDLALGRLRRDAGGTPVLLVLVPSILQADGGQWATKVGGKDGLEGDTADFEMGRLARWYKERCRSTAGLPLLDASPAFTQALARGERIYFPVDQHLTPAGYALLGRLVAEPAQRLLAPPSASPESAPPLPSAVR